MMRSGCGFVRMFEDGDEGFGFGFACCWTLQLCVGCAFVRWGGVLFGELGRGPAKASCKSRPSNFVHPFIHLPFFFRLYSVLYLLLTMNWSIKSEAFRAWLQQEVPKTVLFLFACVVLWDWSVKIHRFCGLGHCLSYIILCRMWDDGDKRLPSSFFLCGLRTQSWHS